MKQTNFREVQLRLVRRARPALSPPPCALPYPDQGYSEWSLATRSSVFLQLSLDTGAASARLSPAPAPCPDSLAAAVARPTGHGDGLSHLVAYPL